MNTLKNLLSGGKYVSPELTVVELQLESAVLSASGWTTSGGGVVDDLDPNGGSAFGN